MLLMICNLFARERERGDLDIELVAILGGHLVGPVHRAGWGIERTKAAILEGLPRLEGGLFADHTRPLDLFHVPFPVGDDPVPTNQLNRLGPFVRDPDVVGKKVVVPLRVGAVFQVLWLGLDLDSLGDSDRHAYLIIQIFP